MDIAMMPNQKIKRNDKPIDVTMSMVKIFSEEGRKNDPFQPKSEAEFLQSIDRSLQQADVGQTRDAFVSLNEISAELERKEV